MYVAPTQHLSFLPSVMLIRKTVETNQVERQIF